MVAIANEEKEKEKKEEWKEDPCSSVKHSDVMHEDFTCNMLRLL